MNSCFTQTELLPLLVPVQWDKTKEVTVTILDNVVECFPPLSINGETYPGWQTDGQQGSI